MDLTLTEGRVVAWLAEGFLPTFHSPSSHMLVFYCLSDVCANSFFSMWNVERTLRWDLSLHSQHLGGCWDVFQCNTGFVVYRMQCKMQIAGVRFASALLFLCLFRLFLGVTYSLNRICLWRWL